MIGKQGNGSKWHGWGPNRKKEKRGKVYCGKRDIAIPPGATIEELLNDRYMNYSEFALKMGFSEEVDVNRLIKGEIKIDEAMARRLQNILGGTYVFWQNLESNYREKLNRKI